MTPETTHAGTTPLAADDMYSTAFNFYSHIAASVDPRTGMYAASIELTTGEGNALRGPAFAFRLSYSPWGVADEGFGVGWHLALTEYDDNTTTVTLSTGDSHPARDVAAGRPATFPDRKLDSFTFVPDKGLRSATVRHLSGVAEYLFYPGPDAPVMRPKKIVNPNGDAIHLGWSRTADGSMRLTQVTDDDDQILLSIDYGASEGVMVNLPLGGPTPLTLIFTREGPWLGGVVVPAIAASNSLVVDAADEARWAFEYRSSATAPYLTLLTSVTSPDGLREDVLYDEQALRLPTGAPRAFLPAVVRKEQRRLADPDKVVRASDFVYSEFGGHNFYGYGIVSTWQSRNDQLLRLVSPTPYLYGSRETLLDGDTVLQTTTRTYNHFHLIVQEMTVRGDVVEQIDTAYGNENNVGFDEQPKAFQMPHRVTVTRWSKTDEAVRQVIVTRNSYDAEGNLLTREDDASGIVETSAYYAPSGEPDDQDQFLCPPDPHGRIHRLKRRTIAAANGKGPARISEFRYVALPARKPENEPLPYVQAHVDMLSVVEEGLPTWVVHNEHEFIVEGPWAGCVSEERRIQDGLTRTRRYSYASDAATQTIITTTIDTSHDGIVTSSREAKHLMSGLVAWTEDLYGHRIEYGYDVLGRTNLEVRHADDPAWRSENHWTFQLSAADRWVCRRGATGLLHLVAVDERGQIVRREEPGPDNLLTVVEQIEYDARGQRTRQTTFDPFPDGKVLTLETAYGYDDWGQCNLLVSPDGASTVTQTSLASDPDESGATAFTQVLQWHEGGGLKSGWQLTLTDAAGRQRCSQVGLWNAAGARVAVATERWSYDELGRCVLATDPLGRDTVQQWDGFDRLVATHLPDGSVIHRRYAPGRDDGALAAISLEGPDGIVHPLGTRLLDGIGRLTEERSGSLLTRHTYRPGQLAASERRLPGGGTLRMSYEPRLGESLRTMTMEDATIVDATYDPRTGLPATVTSQTGSMDIGADYLGRMTRQQHVVGGDAARSSTTTLSFADRVLEETGTDGVTRRFGYDDAGRLASVVDTDVTTQLEYDGLSRLARRLSTSSDGRSVDERTAYDALGRISEQTTWHTRDASTVSYRLTHDWRADNKIVGKSLYEGDQLLRTERMDYDSRGRLCTHVLGAANNEDLPVDDMGNAYVLQTFTHDGLDNLLTVETHLHDGRVNHTRYAYDPIDVDRLIRVENTLQGYPGHDSPLALAYDDNGNLVDDGQGRTLTWDAAGRLASVTLANGETVTYGHTADGRVGRVSYPGRKPLFRYYSDGELAVEFDGDESRRIIRVNGGVVAETRVAQAVRDVLLLGTDPQGSVSNEGGVAKRTYGAYGQEASR